jgi:hypothetical protein
MKRYGQWTASLVAAWFILALGASALHLFENNFNRIGLPVAFAALAPIAVFALWYSRSADFRRFTLSLNPRTLTAVHAWRVGGYSFVALAAAGLLPNLFAWPAGYGDMAIGATALLAAGRLARPEHRAGFIAWQLAGMADLIVAVGLGTTAGILSPEGPSMLLMTRLPLSLVPTFFVPLLFILHWIAIAQAKTWRRDSRTVERSNTLDARELQRLA